jgi:hypothetical protein
MTPTLSVRPAAGHVAPHTASYATPCAAGHVASGDHFAPRDRASRAHSEPGDHFAPRAHSAPGGPAERRVA